MRRTSDGRVGVLDTDLHKTFGCSLSKGLGCVIIMHRRHHTLTITLELQSPTFRTAKLLALFPLLLRMLAGARGLKGGGPWLDGLEEGNGRI